MPIVKNGAELGYFISHPAPPKEGGGVFSQVSAFKLGVYTRSGGFVKPLFTIGYEGKTMGEFLGELVDAGIELLIDVRAVATSRRPGFSKTPLSNALAEKGISYLHLRPLGTPASGREAARKGRIAEMRRIYAGQLETPEAGLAMEQALDAAAGKRSALLCYEAEAADCHRSMLAERMLCRARFKVIDL